VTDFERTTDSWLERHYGGRNKKIAFVDVTYSNHASSTRRAFYAVTAFMIRSNDVNAVRSEFARLANYRKWHTTERFQEPNTEVIRTFSNFVAREPSSSVIVIEIELESTTVPALEEARRICMRGMVRILAEKHAVDSVLYERRRPFEQKIDHETMLPLRAMYPKLVIRDVGSDAEPLLWGADILAWTFQRRLIEHENWFDPFVGVTHVYRPTGRKVHGFTVLPDK
jgi:hypothetical protein